MKYIFCLCFCCILLSCKYREVHLLDTEELSWLEPYCDNDTVIFSSTTGVDSLFISKTINNSPTKLGVHCFSDYYGGGRISIMIKHNNDSIFVTFLVSKFCSNKISFNNCYGSVILKENNAFSDSIGNQIYDDAVFIRNDDFKIPYASNNNCDFLVWSKSKGLLQYKYINGDVYIVSRDRSMNR